MTEAATTQGLRASALKDCPRKCVAEAAGADTRDWTAAERRRMFRGQVAERAYFDWLRSEHPDWTIRQQVEIPWAHGTGHADAYAVEPSLLFEVLSSNAPSASQIDSKLRQLVTYMIHFPEAGSGVLVILDGDSEEQRIPVRRDTDRYRLIAEEVTGRIREVDEWAATGTLPARVCGKPADAIGYFCHAADWCFRGWVPPTLDEIDTAGARKLAVAWYRAKEEEASANALAKAESQKRKALESELAEVVPEGKWLIGPLAVTRTRVQRSPTADLKALELAGVNIPAEYLKPGAAYDLFRAERLSADDPLLEPDDFGDIPF